MSATLPASQRVLVKLFVSFGRGLPTEVASHASLLDGGVAGLVGKSFIARCKAWLKPSAVGMHIRPVPVFGCSVTSLTVSTSPPTRLTIGTVP